MSLITDLKTAPAGSHELDAAIFASLGGSTTSAELPPIAVPRYTRDVDAALTLVPEEGLLQIQMLPTGAALAVISVARLVLRGRATTIALAICVAALDSSDRPSPFEARSSRFQRAALRLEEIAIEVGQFALALDDSGSTCGSCAKVHYNNWPQKQTKDRIVGAADRLREIADTLRRRSHDSEFLGKEAAK